MLRPTRETLTSRLRILLPDLYQDRADVLPVSMGSAGLKYGPDGKVAWDQIWGSFCDLAMAGGPPHRGTLLLPGSREAIAEAPAPYRQVCDELCRGLSMVTGLCAEPAIAPGWVRLFCTSAAMAGWLTRAIVMENVSVSFHGLALLLPAGPAYRLEKEIKNVITAVAKTCHYWREHTSDDRQQAIADQLRSMTAAEPLLQPSSAEREEKALATHLAAALHQATGLTPSSTAYPGWLGFECPTAAIAITTMRLLVASNVLSRREANAVFLPVDPINDPTGQEAVHRFMAVHAVAFPVQSNR